MLLGPGAHLPSRDRVSGLSGWHIIYAKWNSDGICKKIHRISLKTRKDRILQSWPLEKKLLNLSIMLRIHEIYYRISFAKTHGFEHLVVLFEWSTLKSSIFAIFLWKPLNFFINRFRIWFDINNVSSVMLKNGPHSR